MLDDKILLEQYKKGDNEALGKIFIKHRTYLFHVALSKTRYKKEIAEDLVQDGFIRIKRALDNDKFKDQSTGTLKSWMGTIINNLAFDFHRKKKRIPSNPGTIISNEESDEDIIWEKLGSEKTIEDLIITEETYKELHNWIRRLTLDQRYILEQRYYEKRSFKSLAKELGISINTCLGRMRYALINVRKIRTGKTKTMRNKEEYIAENSLKVCKGCDKAKPIEEFYKESKTEDGFNPKCKECITTYHKERKEIKKEKNERGVFPDLDSEKEEKPIIPKIKRNIRYKLEGSTHNDLFSLFIEDITEEEAMALIKITKSGLLN